MDSKEDQAYIREVARLYFQNLPKETRSKVEFFFRGLDEDGNRTLSLQEIVDSPLTDRFGPGFASHAAQLFSFLDFDGSNSLDFNEFITLVFLYTVKAPTCNHCSCIIIRPPYTCATCLHQTDPYFLCLPCYSSKAFSHPHPDLFLYYGLDHTIANTPNEVQCMICGDYHSTNAKPCLDQEGKHIQMVDPHGYVCEYCMCITCSSCVKYILGDIGEAKPSHFVEEGNVCKDCDVVEPWTIDLNTVYQSIIDEEQELLQTCNTCRIKVKNLTLFQNEKRELAIEESESTREESDEEETKSTNEESGTDKEETKTGLDDLLAQQKELQRLANQNMQLHILQMGAQRNLMMVQAQCNMWRNW